MDDRPILPLEHLFGYLESREMDQVERYLTQVARLHLKKEPTAQRPIRPESGRPSVSNPSKLYRKTVGDRSQSDELTIGFGEK